MGSVTFEDLPEQALLQIDANPIIHVLEGHVRFASRFKPLFDAHAAGRVRFAVTTIAVAEILTGPLRSRQDALACKYRTMFDSWLLVPLDVEIAERAAQLRASLKLRFADAVQVASALAINAAALVTHDRDFSRVRSLRIIS
jgi:predicted nucleic acid-binding protein